MYRDNLSIIMVSTIWASKSEIAKHNWAWFRNFICLRAVHKRRPKSGKDGYFQCGHFADKEGGGSSDANVRLFGAKNIGYFEIYGVFARTRERGLSQFGHFADKEWVNFLQFCADFLWTALYKKHVLRLKKT